MKKREENETEELLEEETLDLSMAEEFDESEFDEPEAVIEKKADEGAENRPKKRRKKRPKSRVEEPEKAEKAEKSEKAEKVEKVEKVKKVKEPEAVEESHFAGVTYLDDEDNEEEKGGHKGLKIFGITLGTVLALAAAAYAGVSVYYMSHFFKNTTVNGFDCSGMKVEEVEQVMASQVDGYSLTLLKSDNTKEVIEGSKIDMKYDDQGDVKKLMASQNAFSWPKSFIGDNKFEYTAPIGVVYDKAKLTSAIQGLDLMKSENQTPAQSSEPKFDGTKFSPSEETVGAEINQSTFNTKVAEAIESFTAELDLTKEGCYVPAKYNSKSPEVQTACDEMNKYLGAQITYVFSSQTEVVGSELISQWIIRDENMNITFNEEAVRQYVAGLAEKYDTLGKTREFVSGSGAVVSVTGGDFGWSIDEDTEYEALLNSIRAGEVITKEPEYYDTAVTHDGPDWGGTYVEVDLTNQWMYLFVDGEMIIDAAPIVTGKPSQGDATPQGAYYIKYCARNATLRGPKQADGSYEWESPVAFWMPFNGGIGLHDASWQAAFGGSRYLTHGSHGCVNLQYSVAQTVFEYVEAGTPVICHY